MAGLVKSTIFVAIAIIGFVITASTSVNFVIFLSSFPNVTTDVSLVNITVSGKEEIANYALWACLADISLLCIFILQHSSLVLPLNEIMAYLKIPSLERTVYNGMSSLLLQLLMYYWKPIRTFVLWEVDVEDNIPMWAFFLAIQMTGWLMIYLPLISMDIPELLGIKQVYYDVTNRLDPSKYKAPELRRLYRQIRHPSFIGFFVVFWVFPYMRTAPWSTICDRFTLQQTLFKYRNSSIYKTGLFLIVILAISRVDRFLLAAVWTVYITLAWTPDRSDVNYMAKQQARKSISSGRPELRTGSLRSM